MQYVFKCHIGYLLALASIFWHVICDSNWYQTKETKANCDTRNKNKWRSK